MVKFSVASFMMGLGVMLAYLIGQKLSNLAAMLILAVAVGVITSIPTSLIVARIAISSARSFADLTGPSSASLPAHVPQPSIIMMPQQSAPAYPPPVPYERTLGLPGRPARAESSSAREELL